MTTGEDIAASCLKLEDAPYRVWYLGMSLPTWLDDGRGYLPPVSHLFDVGVECADLVDFAMMDNDLEPGAGTESFKSILVDQQPFDPELPGQPGAIALCPYSGPALSQQGHIAVYLDESTIVQALYRDGVTRAYTDAETYAWGGSTAFTIYGFLPGVDYSGNGAAPVQTDKPDWKQFGWYEMHANWSLTWNGPS